jgi:alpha-beta hydrolase superfamily lysophospholipase
MNGTEEAYTTSDNYVCGYRSYPAQGEPRAEVVCLHGIQSHAGWYEGSCSRLAAAGFQVSFLERRGSGRNGQARGDTPHYQRLLDDVAEFLRPLRERVSRPIVLLAISWGGKIAIALQQRHPGLVDALALLCPGFCPLISPSWGQRFGILWARLTQPTRLFPVPLNDPELFTTNPRWLDFLRNDPLALRQATARFLVHSVRLDWTVRRAARKVFVPTLLLLAGRDRIIDNARTRRFVNRFAAPARIIEYPEACHTLEFEPEPQVYLSDLLNWLHTLPRRRSP